MSNELNAFEKTQIALLCHIAVSLDQIARKPPFHLDSCEERDNQMDQQAKLLSGLTGQVTKLVGERSE